MSGFKDFLEKAADVFVNADNFAEIYTINGVEIPIVLDQDLLRHRQNKTVDPNSRIHQASVLFHVKKADYGDKPGIEETVNFDGEIYRVEEITEDCGIYTIAISANLL